MFPNGVRNTPISKTNKDEKEGQNSPGKRDAFTRKKHKTTEIDAAHEQLKTATIEAQQRKN